MRFWACPFCIRAGYSACSLCNNGSPAALMNQKKPSWSRCPAQLTASVAHEGGGDSIVAGSAVNLIDDGHFKGFAGAPGIGIGTSVANAPIADLDAVPSRPAEDITVELTLLDRAIEAVRNDIRSLIQSLTTSLPQEELALFKALHHWITVG